MSASFYERVVELLEALTGSAEITVIGSGPSGEVSVIGSVEVANDAGNPLPVVAPAGGIEVTLLDYAGGQISEFNALPVRLIPVPPLAVTSTPIEISQTFTGALEVDDLGVSLPSNSLTAGLVHLRLDHAASYPVFLGNSVDNGLVLLPGDSVTLRVSDTDQVDLISPEPSGSGGAASSRVYWWAS